MLLGAIVSLPPTVCGAEAEVYVITGPDGIEIFSNLPRSPLPVPQPVKGQGAFAIAQSEHLSEVASQLGGDAEAPGKTFMQDD